MTTTTTTTTALGTCSRCGGSFPTRTSGIPAKTILCTSAASCDANLAVRPKTVTVFGGGWVYADLKPGDVFHFWARPEVLFVKGRGGWFTYENGHVGRFRTGSRTSVVPVKGL